MPSVPESTELLRQCWRQMKNLICSWMSIRELQTDTNKCIWTRRGEKKHHDMIAFDEPLLPSHPESPCWLLLELDLRPDFSDIPLSLMLSRSRFRPPAPGPSPACGHRYWCSFHQPGPRGSTWCLKNHHRFNHRTFYSRVPDLKSLVPALIEHTWTSRSQFSELLGNRRRVWSGLELNPVGFEEPCFTAS